MLATALRHLNVADPSIGQKFGAFIGNVAAKWYEVFAEGIGYPTDSRAPEPLRRIDLYRYDHKLFLFATATRMPRHTMNGGTRGKWMPFNKQFRIRYKELR